MLSKEIEAVAHPCRHVQFDIHCAGMMATLHAIAYFI
jgi:hypothetical protein